MALPFNREYLDLLWAGGDLSSEPPLEVPGPQSLDVPEWRDVSHPDIEARIREEEAARYLEMLPGVVPDWAPPVALSRALMESESPLAQGAGQVMASGMGYFNPASHLQGALDEDYAEPYERLKAEGYRHHVEPFVNLAQQAPGMMGSAVPLGVIPDVKPPLDLTPEQEHALLTAAMLGGGHAAFSGARALGRRLRPPAPRPAPVRGTAYDDLAELKARLDAPSEAPPAAYETLAAEPAAAAPKSARVGMREAYKGIRAPRHEALEEGAYRGSGEYGKMRAKQSVHRDAVDSALTPEDVGVLKDYGRQFYPPGSSIFDKVDNVIAKAPKRAEAIDLWRAETVGTPGDRFQRADLETLKPGDVLDLDRPRSADSTLSNVAANWMQGPDKVLFRFADNRNSIPAGLYTGIMDEHIVPSGKYVVKGSYYDTTTSLAAPYGAAWRQEQPARLVVELAEEAPALAPGRPAIKEAYAKARPEVVPKVYLKESEVSVLPPKPGWRDSYEIRHGADSSWVIGEGKPLSPQETPETLYHVTGRGKEIRGSGLLRGQSTTAEGGFGGGAGGEGVSFTSSQEKALWMERELKRSAEVANASTVDEAWNIIRRVANEDGEAGQRALGSIEYTWKARNKNLDNAVEIFTNDYMSARESASRDMLRDAGHTYPYPWTSMENPLLFGGRDSFSKLNPDDIEVMSVSRDSIPEGALVRHGEKFTDEIRVHADVPVPAPAPAPAPATAPAPGRPALRAAYEAGKPEPVAPEPLASATPAPLRPVKPVEQTRWFHGTKADISDIGDFDPYYHGNPENLFGYGLYLTDEPAIATGYAKTRGPKASPGQIMEVQVDALNTLDLDRPLPPDVVGHFGTTLYGETYTPDPNATGREVVQGLRDFMGDHEFPTSEASEVLGDLAEVLKDKGYAGMRHIGGRTGRGVSKGKPEHNVLILFDPNDIYVPSLHGQPVRQPRVEARSVRSEPVAPEPPLPTQTPAFRRWFGESKVVDEKGEPMVVYHGTTAEFDQFDTSESLGAHFGTSKAANDRIRDMAGVPGRHAHVKPVFIRVERPYRLPDLDQWDQDEVLDFLDVDDSLDWSKWSGGSDGLRSDVEVGGDYEPIQEFLRRNGYDGIVYQNREEGVRYATSGERILDDSYIVFDPTQIKSATGNVGTYDPKDPRIAYGIAGAAAAADED